MAREIEPTREQLRDPVKASLDLQREWCYRRLYRVAARGTAGAIGPKQAPGYAVGINAVAKLLDRIDPIPQGGVGARITAVTVILESGPAHPALPQNGGGVHLVLGDGDGT